MWFVECATYTAVVSHSFINELKGHIERSDPAQTQMQHSQSRYEAEMGANSVDSFKVSSGVLRLHRPFEPRLLV